MRILTFGSCLARYTANNFIKLFGGEVVTSVFHNRSDAFIERFVDRNWVSYEFEEMNRLLRPLSADDNPDADPALILRNQYEEWIGLHRLPKGIGLFEGLRHKSYDLIIADNYMDLAGRLVSKPGDSRAGIFLRPTDFEVEDPNWVYGDFLTPEAGVHYMKRILEFFRSQAPEAKLVFMNFPYNTYKAMNRIKRTKEYQRLFSFDGALVIPCIEIRPIFQTASKQHYKREQYCAYAGWIYQHLL